MKKGYYLRYVPSLGYDCFYIWNGVALFVLGELCFHVLKENGKLNWAKFENCIEWYKSMQDKPTKKLGFEYICNLEGN